MVRDMKAYMEHNFMVIKYVVSRHLFVKSRIKVPNLHTCSRIPRRRERIQYEKKFPLDLTLKIDLQTWQFYPENVFDISLNKGMQTDIYKTKVSPVSEWTGSYNGQRYFGGRLPNHHEWKECRISVVLLRVEGGIPYFKLLTDKREEEWNAWKKLFHWYYSGRPGKKLVASEEQFEEGQIVVVRTEDDDFRRGRFFKENIPRAIIKDLDSGEFFYASLHKTFAIDPQFLKIPFRAINCTISNRGTIMNQEFVQHGWPLFSGTDTLAGIEEVLPLGLEKQNGLHLTNFKMDINMEETLSADIGLNWKRSSLLEALQHILINQIPDRFQNVENHKCRVTSISKYGSVWLCTDSKLLDAVHDYINDESHKQKIRDRKLKVAAEYGFQSSIEWFNGLLIPGEEFIVVGDYDHALYRAVLLEVSPDLQSYLVELIDFGITKRLFNVGEFWCKLPSSKLPKYINALPPLSKKYNLQGVYRVSRPYKIMNQFHGNKFDVQIIDAHRTETVRERYRVKIVNVPSVLLKCVADNGEVTLDVNKTLQRLQSTQGRAPSVPRQYPARRGEKIYEQSKIMNVPIIRSFGI